MKKTQEGSNMNDYQSLDLVYLIIITLSIVLPVIMYTLYHCHGVGQRMPNPNKSSIQKQSIYYINNKKYNINDLQLIARTPIAKEYSGGIHSGFVGWYSNEFYKSKDNELIMVNCQYSTKNEIIDTTFNVLSKEYMSEFLIKYGFIQEANNL